MAAGAGIERIIFPLGAVMEREAMPALYKNPQMRVFHTTLQDVISVAEQSPTGRALLRAAVMGDVAVGLDPLLDAQTSFYYPLQRRLDLGYLPDALQKSHKGISQYLTSFCGGLRRIWQQSRGLAPDTMLKPEDYMRYCRAFEADVSAITYLVAWELRAAGPCFFWRYLLAGVDGDVATAFARTAGAHPRHQFDGTALRAAFLQWFQVSERMDASDHQALEMMDMALINAAQQGGMIGRKALDMSSLSALGAIPQGGNYLTGMRFRGPQMRRAADPFNRTHLQHIQRDLSYMIENQKSF